jgi:hypothetical protein
VKYLFKNFSDFFDENGILTDWVGFLVFLEQKLVGNKRLSLYGNTLMSITLLMHPTTISLAMYYVSQVTV